MANKTIADTIEEAIDAGLVGQTAVLAALAAVGIVPASFPAAKDVTATPPETDPTWIHVQAALDDIAARLDVLEP